MLPTALLANLKVRVKVLLSFAAVTLFFGVALLIGWNSITTVSNKVRHGYSAAVLAQSASAAAYNMHVSQMQYVADGGHVLAMHHGDKAVFEKALAGLKQQARTPAERTALARVEASYATWKQVDNKVFALINTDQSKTTLVLAEGKTNSISNK